MDSNVDMVKGKSKEQTSDGQEARARSWGSPCKSNYVSAYTRLHAQWNDYKRIGGDPKNSLFTSEGAR